MSKIFDKRALNPNVIQLGIVSLLADISSEMLYPLTPIFLTTVLGATMFQVGLTEAVAESLASVLKLYAGRWSDRLHNRKVFVWVGYLLTALAKPLVGISGNWVQVWGARSLDRTGKGLRTAPRDALVSESVAAEVRGLAFGWHRAMDSIGAVIGPLFALYFLHGHPGSFRSLYFWAFIPGLAAVAVVFKVREPKAEIKKAPTKDKFSYKDFSGAFKFYIASWSIFAVANSSDVFLILKARDSGLAVEKIILLYCLFCLIYAIASPFMGELSDRINRKFVLMGGLFVFSTVYAGFAFAKFEWQFAVLFAIYGIYMAATDGVGKAFCVDLIPPQHKAAGLGHFAAVTGIASLLASVTAGLLWDHVGSASCFIFGAAGAGLSALMLLVGQKNPRAT